MRLFCLPDVGKGITPALCDLEVLRVTLDADELTACVDAGHAGCAAAHTAIEDGISYFRACQYKPLHKLYRLFCRVDF